jgi:hypothetical protein
MSLQLARSTLDVGNDDEPQIGGIDDGSQKQQWGKNQQI